MTEEQIEELLKNSRSFYEVMQSYRNAPMHDQGHVTHAFNEVIYFIVDNIGWQ